MSYGLAFWLEPGSHGKQCSCGGRDKLFSSPCLQSCRLLRHDIDNSMILRRLDIDDPMIFRLLRHSVKYFCRLSSTSLQMQNPVFTVLFTQRYPDLVPTQSIRGVG